MTQNIIFRADELVVVVSRAVIDLVVNVAGIRYYFCSIADFVKEVDGLCLGDTLFVCYVIITPFELIMMGDRFLKGSWLLVATVPPLDVNELLLASSC